MSSRFTREKEMNSVRKEVKNTPTIHFKGKEKEKEVCAKNSKSKEKEKTPVHTISEPLWSTSLSILKSSPHQSHTSLPSKKKKWSTRRKLTQTFHRLCSSSKSSAKCEPQLHNHNHTIPRKSDISNISSQNIIFSSIQSYENDAIAELEQQHYHNGIIFDKLNNKLSSKPKSSHIPSSNTIFNFTSSKTFDSDITLPHNYDICHWTNYEVACFLCQIGFPQYQEVTFQFSKWCVKKSSFHSFSFPI
jgi:hypothetical protein